MSSNQLALRLASEPAREATYTQIAAGASSFVGIGTALANPSRKILFQNYTDVLIIFSDDGVTEKFVLNPGTQFILDISINQHGDYYAQGTRFYAAQAVGVPPTTGGVYLSTWYGAS